MSIGRQSDKATRYLSQLDAARCNGTWAEVPELARKVEKHAPSRKSLACTARAEAQIAKQPSKRPASGVPPGTATTANPLLHLARELESAIALENQYPEDAYQAQTSLSWLYWNFGDYALAKANVPQELPPSINGKEGGSNRLQGWTYVCLVKAAFIRGSSEEAIGRRQDIQAVYESCLQSLESLPSTFSGSAEYNFWWERFFSRCCGSFYGSFQDSVKKRKSHADPILCLTAFRSWAKHWGSSQGASMDTTSESAIRKRSQRRLVWKSYYDLLSEIILLDLPYPAHSTQGLQLSEKSTADDQRGIQYQELEKVKAVYEGILLRDISFPEASKVNVEIDEWVETVMSNWSVLCGFKWHDRDLGDAGKAGVGRKTLDILYRAATRTFHSTSVLRHLFTVHASLAEFELAERALDSYLEIVSKGKARVEKSGHPEPSLDSDEMMLRTIAAGIEMLCESGKRKQVQKSTVLARTLEQWLLKHENPSPNGPGSEETGQNSESAMLLSTQVLSAIHKAIGTSKASWARLTYETSMRSQLQAEAIAQFRAALRCDHAAEEDPSILYALALALAESRDIEDAIAAVKQALASESRTFTDPVDKPSFVEELRTRVTRTGPLTECWHLLALLLSSRQEFETAEVACSTILEQFETPKGQVKARSEASTMGFFDKQQFIEAKMTQMSLIEINDGPELAVNTGINLLRLYTNFFDNPASKPPPTEKTNDPPHTATGTIKSFRGSFFGRHKDTKSIGRENTAALSVLPRRLSEGTSRAPTIAINEETPKPQQFTNLSQVTRQNSGKLQKRVSKRSIKRSRPASPTRVSNQISEAEITPTKAAPVKNTPAKDPMITEGNLTDTQLRSPSELAVTSNHEQPNGVPNYSRPGTATSYDPSEVGIAVSHDLRASVTAQFNPLSAANLPPPLEEQPGVHRERLPESDFYLQASTIRKPSFVVPAPLFPESDNRRFALSLLQRIWLFIAALYRRAGMLEDAREAVDEAFKQAKLVEAAVAAESQVTVQDFDEPAWGGVRSVEEIWADAYAEMGNLCVAEGDPYEAMIKYEGALSHVLDHPAASVCLANILLDIYSQKIPLQPKQPSLGRHLESEGPKNESTMPIFSKFPSSRTLDSTLAGLDDSSAIVDGEFVQEADAIPVSSSDPWSDDPEVLDRLAARDRAYGLLSALTKLGLGWDDSEAWFALARAYEESGQAEKAREVLWWVVELEEKRPIRHWRCLGEGYKLRH